MHHFIKTASGVQITPLAKAIGAVGQQASQPCRNRVLWENSEPEILPQPIQWKGDLQNVSAIPPILFPGTEHNQMSITMQGREDLLTNDGGAFNFSRTVVQLEGKTRGDAQESIPGVCHTEKATG